MQFTTASLISCAFLVLVGCASVTSGDATGRQVPAQGHAQVARLPAGDGLQYCINLRPQDLAPPGARNVIVHSLSAYLSTVDSNEPTLTAITGRYPGWDTPGTTVYTQPFTSNNSVWLEIIHEFPLGVACIEVYGRGLRPSSYTVFKNKMLVSFSYLPRRSPGVMTTKFFRISWGPYLKRYSPRHRPKH